MWPPEGDFCVKLQLPKELTVHSDHVIVILTQVQKMVVFAAFPALIKSIAWV